ncbi:MAG: type II secretion system major pseudopilin GspG [Pirellulales bacterium]
MAVRDFLPPTNGAASMSPVVRSLCFRERFGQCRAETVPFQPRFRRCRDRRHAAGFTLMEVLLVLVILVILGSFAVNIFSGTRAKANIDAARTEVSLVEKAARFFELHMSRYPGSLEDLVRAPSDAAGTSKWGGPYLQKQVPADPWGNPYRYLVPGKHFPDAFDVWSLGPDGVDGTEDDIGNWE